MACRSEKTDKEPARGPPRRFLAISQVAAVTIEPRCATAMRLLVVEDAPKMASLLRRGLTEEGYAVDVVSNGTDAVWMATEEPFDAIVLDVLRPEIDGFEGGRRLRRSDRWAPLLMLAARRDKY